MGCSPEKVENPVASRSPDRHRWQAPPDPRLKPRKNTHFHLLKDASHTLRMEQPRPLDGSKVQTLETLIKSILLSRFRNRLNTTDISESTTDGNARPKRMHRFALDVTEKKFRRE